MNTDNPARRRDLLTGRVNDEGVVYDRERGSVHSLNVTALCVWDLCDGQHDVDEIAQDLSMRFDVALPAAKEDVARALGLFRELCLLED